MIILDHNITKNQTELLSNWRFHFRQIGYEVGRPEWDDQQEVLRYLHSLKQATFFTRDLGFFHKRFCHPSYCIVVITGPALQTAVMIRRLLRHHDFKTKAKRRGKVIRLSSANVAWWETGHNRQQHLLWQ